MNGKCKPNFVCAFCSAQSKYGENPEHKPGCEYLGRYQDCLKNCPGCGHWSEKHHNKYYNKQNPSVYGCYGCDVIDCKCEIDCDTLYVQPKAEIKCVCGATRASGIPIGSPHHSHFGYSDPSKWCPASEGYQPPS